MHQKTDEPEPLLLFLREELSEIDAACSAAGIPLRDRPMRATRAFVDACVLAVKFQGEEQVVGADMLLTPWFKLLYQATQTWYEERYGQALAGGPARLTVALTIFGVPFALRVPTVVTRVETPGETSWMIYATKVHDGEDPLDWIEAPPNFTSLPELETQNIRRQAGEPGSLARSIRLNLMTADKPDDVSQGLAGNVMSHLESAARFLTENPEPNRLGLATWDAHQSVEKVLKLFLRQNGKQPQKTHDISALAASAKLVGGLDLGAALLAALPDKALVIALRASEAPPLDLQQAMLTYTSALKLVETCSTAMPRQFVMNDARFLIKKPPWLGD